MRQVGDVIVDDAARTIVRAGHTVDLTRTEFELLACLAMHPGQVLSKAQLLNPGFGDSTPTTSTWWRSI